MLAALSHDESILVLLRPSMAWKPQVKKAQSRAAPLATVVNDPRASLRAMTLVLRASKVKPPEQVASQAVHLVLPPFPRTVPPSSHRQSSAQIEQVNERHGPQRSEGRGGEESATMRRKPKPVPVPHRAAVARQAVAQLREVGVQVRLRLSVVNRVGRLRLLNLKRRRQVELNFPF